MSNIEFTQNFSQLQALLSAFAYRLTKNEDDAQDLLQETAYKAFKYKSMYQPKTNLRAWLMTIMRNTFINNYRQRKRRNTLSDNTNSDYWINSKPQVVNNIGESSMMAEEIQAQIDTLEDWLKVPFLMYVQGYKYEEIAEKMEIPLGTVKSRIFFARQKLQKAISNMYKGVSPSELLK
ncbi:MAG: RNA polymerase sigma factor [Saprospiraceae bacterium]|nr:RNA polymerase sigma factor [Saprospiraceae bacterium]